MPKDATETTMAAGTPPQDGHYVKRVVLPSGKTIEVVYFDTKPEDVVGETATASSPAIAPEAPSRIPHDLHICQGCRSELVYPIEWEEAGAEYWRVVLRCPNCEWSASGVFPQELVDLFDERLDQGTEQMVTDLKHLMRANMTEEIDRFVDAMDAGAILPEDF
jgi:hypothetical protein